VGQAGPSVKLVGPLPTAPVGLLRGASLKTLLVKGGESVCCNCTDRAGHR
jgi:hypothetical protein